MSASAGPVTTLPAAARRALAGVWWYLRELSGEARWDDYLERCEHQGGVPMTRRDFERHRDEHRENSTQGRCC